MLPTIATGNVASALPSGYEVANSCRFNDGDSAYMHKTPGSTGVEEKFTFSAWLKFNHTASSNQCLLYVEGDDSGDYIEIALKPELDIQYGNGTYSRYVTNRKFRDPSAWFHLVIAVDTTQSVAGNRHKIYINGTLETSFSTETAIPQNDVLQANTSGKKMWLGCQYNGPQNFYDGYMAEVVWIDGTQYAASDFGEFDEDSPTIWKPKDVSELTFGTNGFYLDFEDSANLGNDANGGTDLTEVNLAATDQATDTPTNNFCTLNPLTNHSNGITLSEGNLKCTTSDSPWQGQSATFGVSAGKWYYEVLATETSVDQYIVAGIQSDYLASSQAGTFGFLYNYSYGMKFYDGDKVYNESDGGTSADHGNAVTDGQIVGVAFDLDNQKMYFSINGTWQNSGDPTSGATGTGSITNLQSGQTYIPNITLGNSGGDPIASVNFGSPSFAISSGNSDADGYGNFEYSVPSGYYSLCTKNLGAYGG